MVSDRQARFWFYVVWTQEQLGRVKKFLNRVAPEVLQDPASNSIDPNEQKWIDMLIGKQCRVKVTVEKYEDEDRNRVKDVLSLNKADDFLNT